MVFGVSVAGRIALTIPKTNVRINYIVIDIGNHAFHNAHFEIKKCKVCWRTTEPFSINLKVSLRVLLNWGGGTGQFPPQSTSI